MKKLVKTAKQQFEERLKNLTILREYTHKYEILDEYQKYYLCEDKDKKVFVLIENGEMFEQLNYCATLADIENSESFLRNMTKWIASSDRPLQPFLQWCASDRKGETPYNLFDFVQCTSVVEEVRFEDFYDEVPDNKNFTAEIKDLRWAMVSQIFGLDDLGYEVDTAWLLKNADSITWSGGGYEKCSNIKEFYFRKSDNGLDFGYKRTDDDDRHDIPLHYLSIETLQDVINAMQ